jgi:hypothetical protein
MEPDGPSAFTPFLRRFTDETARDLSDTRELYRTVMAKHRASDFARPDVIQTVGGNIYGEFCELLTEPIVGPVCQALDAILRLEHTIFDAPDLNFDVARLSLKEQVDLQRFLRSKEHFLANEARVIGLLAEGCVDLFWVLAGRLPKFESPSPFNIPLINALPDPRDFIDTIYAILWRQRYVDNGLFVELSTQLYYNICAVSGIANPQEPKKPFKTASKNDAPLHEIAKQYLKGTPLLELFNAPVPLQFTHEDRFSHMHIVGGTNAGKTQLLQNLILNDLHSDESPALIVIDSQGDLINKLSHLAIFDPDASPAKRFLLISPKDIKHPPALNIFDLNKARLNKYDDATKEQVIAGVIETFDYLFQGLLGADLTAKQGVFFRFVARLMLAIPETMGRNATILDMINLMDDPAPYGDAIKSLPPIQRNFFERDFVSKTFAQTKEQIRYRLNAILENPTLARLFTSEHTKVDLFDELNNNAIILVDTAKDFLKGSSGHFGRIFISLILQAVLERAVIPEKDRKPAFLVVDEAAAYFDSNIDDLLTQARKYKVGCVFAHQFLDQCTSSLRSSLAANTSIKMAGGVSMGDARALAPDLRTTADFVIGQPKLHFAAHIRNVTPSAVSIPVEVGLLESQPKLTAEAYESLIELNRVRVSLPQPIQGDGFTMRPDSGPEPEPDDSPAAASSGEPATSDETAISKEWQ